MDIKDNVETFKAGRYGLKSILIKQRGICLCALEWPAMPCMKWLPALGIPEVTLMLKMIGLFPAASQVILRPPKAVF